MLLQEREPCRPISAETHSCELVILKALFPAFYANDLPVNPEEEARLQALRGKAAQLGDSVAGAGGV